MDVFDTIFALEELLSKWSQESWSYINNNFNFHSETFIICQALAGALLNHFTDLHNNSVKYVLLSYSKDGETEI